MRTRGSTVAVVIVTYGDRSRVLERSLEGVLGQTARFLISSIIVVDNGAVLATRQFLARAVESDSRVHIVRLSSNCGSAGGFAVGLQTAYESGAEFAWCLDDDNLPAPDALEQLLNYWPHAGSTALLLSLRRDRRPYRLASQRASMHRAFGRRFSFHTFSVVDLGLSIRRFTTRRSQGNTARPNQDWETSIPGDCQPGTVVVPQAPYGGLLIHRSILEEVGYPRTDFYLYWDDVEFSTRCIQHGYQIHLVLGSLIRDLPEPPRSEFRLTNDSQAGTELSEDGPPSESAPPMAPGRYDRKFYSARNRTYLECFVFGWRKNPLYWANMAGYFLAKSMSVLVSGKRTPRAWRELAAVASGTLQGLRGHLGRREDA